MHRVFSILWEMCEAIDIQWSGNGLTDVTVLRVFAIKEKKFSSAVIFYVQEIDFRYALP